MAKHYINQLKGKWGILLLGLIGVILLLYGGRTESAPSASANGDYFREAEEYRLALESRLEKICASLSGVSEPEVLVTLASGEVSEYASSGSGQVVISGGDGLLVSRKMPRISGVAVVCGGGERIAVKSELTALISAALNIGAHQIHVSGR